MYNATIPTEAELPSSGQLLRSTMIAAATAVALLVTAVLPAEYGIDPTGIGRALGLTEMGEVKASLAKEAQDGEPAMELPPSSHQRSDIPRSFWPRLASLVVAPAAAATVAETAAGTELAQAAKSDEVSVTLRPGEGAEIKLEMRQGAKANFAWRAAGGAVNFDTHGEPYNAASSFSHSYNKGRQVAGDEGVLQAAFDGTHGWFWRNRGRDDVVIKLRTSGDYLRLKHVR